MLLFRVVETNPVGVVGVRGQDLVIKRIRQGIAVNDSAEVVKDRACTYWIVSSFRGSTQPKASRRLQPVHDVPGLRATQSVNFVSNQPYAMAHRAHLRTEGWRKRTVEHSYHRVRSRGRALLQCSPNK